MNGGYDDGYKACPCFWGVEPGSLVTKLADLVSSFSGMRALDVGCGEGKNAVYLAERGAMVEAVDVSEFAISNAKALWASRDLSIRWLVADAARMSFEPNTFDLVVAYGYLHCLSSKTEALDALQSLKTAVAPGGILIVCAFNSRHQELHAHPGFRPTLLSHSEYLSALDDWALLIGTDSDLTETHPHNGIEHSHSMTRLVARKHA